MENLRFVLLFAWDTLLPTRGLLPVMAKVCDITGKRPRVGNNVSHANNKTKRKFYPNLHKKNFYVPEEDAWITLKVCSKALKTINKNGITAVLKKAQDSGMIVIR